MNKTVSINLGGLFFHIDENAYQKLSHYFDAIRRSLSPDGKDEIMNDIEGRIAELLSEKLKTDKQVVSLREVEEVIAVMGNPEDYKLDDEGAAQQSQSYYVPGYNPVRTRKFYRDGDKGMIGGVCAGLAHYFRIDPLWIRIIFILSLLISFGTSVIVYILLWILIPKAITTTEKLEMTGEPINISNIEKKVREEINSVTERLQNVDYEKMGATAKRGAERVGSTIGDVFMAIFKGLAKVLGALITIFAALTLGALIIGFFTMLFSSTIPDTPWYHYANIGNYTDVPLWVVGLLILLVVGIPFFFLFLLGLKILVNNMRSVGSITKYTLLAIWLIAVGFGIYLGIRQASEIGYEGKTVQKEQISLAAADTLYIKFRYNDYFAKTVDHNADFRITQDAGENNVIYSNRVELHYLKTDQPAPYMQIEKVSEGNSISDARNRAENIKYNFEIQGNKLILDNYLLTDIESQYRNQKVKLYLYLPEGFIIHADKSTRHYNHSDYTELNVPYDEESHLYKLSNEELVCLDCPEEPENGKEWDAEDEANGNIDITKENVDVKVNLNGDSINIRATSRNN